LCSWSKCIQFGKGTLITFTISTFNNLLVQPKTWYRMRNVFCRQILAVFWMVGRITSVSYSMYVYVSLMILGSLKYIAAETLWSELSAFWGWDAYSGIQISGYWSNSIRIDIPHSCMISEDQTQNGKLAHVQPCDSAVLCWLWLFLTACLLKSPGFWWNKWILYSDISLLLSCSGDQNYHHSCLKLAYVHFVLKTTGVRKRLYPFFIFYFFF
jgi:hypothetical protein